MKKKEFKTVDVSLLKEHPSNPNRHPEFQIDAIIKSIQRYGQYYPIIVDEDMNILCGHGKRMAIVKMGMKTADVLVMHGLTEQEKKKLIIEDNKIQNMSVMDGAAVDDLIREIGCADIIGFDDDYINLVLNDSPTVDNMCVDHSVPIRVVPEEQVRDEVSDNCGIASIEKATEATENYSVHIMKCPHCGKEFSYER